ncbi:MAG: hypothetical protein EXR93_03415 [Gemmatimonadetes bacterium]|nr:hypothetical protein [Gemmatimonadota bacterium]
MSQPRSSLAIALGQYYTGPVRPGVALTIAAVALLATLVVGVFHVIMLGRSGMAISAGQQTMRMLNRYNAVLEVWRQMAALPEKEIQFPQQIRLRDSIASALRTEFTTLQGTVGDSVDKRLIGSVLSDLAATVPGSGTGRMDLGTQGLGAMIVLSARQDSALFRAAADYQRSQFLAAVLIGLTVIASASLIFPISWAYIRYKQGIPPGL